jgi:hypothetical protein
VGEALTKDRKSKAGCLRFLVKLEVIAEYLGMPEAVMAVSSMRGESGVEASRTEARVACLHRSGGAWRSVTLTPSTVLYRIQAIAIGTPQQVLSMQKNTKRLDSISKATILLLEIMPNRAITN